MPEGTIAFANEPLMRVTGTLFEAQLVETFVLSAINTETMIASKAARTFALQAIRRCWSSARAAPHRRKRSPPRARRTSPASPNLERRSGLSLGHPHHRHARALVTMVHDNELEAFEHYVNAFPDQALLLVDTYDTLEGTRRAIKAAGPMLRGVRLDSGDLLELSRGRCACCSMKRA